MMMKHFQTGLSGAPEDKGANLPHLYSNLPFPTIMPPNRYPFAADKYDFATDHDHTIKRQFPALTWRAGNWYDGRHTWA